MPRKLIRRYMPKPESLKDRWFLRPFNALLHDPALIFPNRRNASKALALGLFFAFIPMPMQMVPAALFAIWWRVNIPIAVGAVWITNPVTMGPIFYAEYRLGAWLLDTPIGDWSIELSWRWLTEEMLRIWEPMLLGAIIFSTVFAIGGYFVLNGLWMASVMQRFQARPWSSRFPIHFRKSRQAD